VAEAKPTILARREGAVLHLTLDRPQVRNAMSLAMVQELRTALGEAEADGTTRIIVLRGAGGHFCSGGDIADMAATRQRLAREPDAFVNTSRAFGELCVAFANTGLAVVAVLQGAVMGGGFGLACVADITLADDTVVFRLPETSRGILPAQVAPFVVERIGVAEARRLAITGAKVDSQEALRLRLVHEVHVEDALDWALARTVKAILGGAPRAIAATKALLARARHRSAADIVPEAAELFSQALLGPEGIEGTLAFLQKRAPNWAPAEEASRAGTEGTA
jgi:isohexenylglutaconyl-CoA hydratase